jgi:hypothetical protein
MKIWLPTLWLVSTLGCVSQAFAAPVRGWEARLPYPTSNPIQDVVHANGIFVAVGDAGTILTSPDADEWTTQTSGTVNNLNAVTFGNGLFVAVGSEGPLLRSTDGVRWDSSPSPTQLWLWGVTYANGLFVAVGWAGTVLTSPDGANWIQRTSGGTDWLTDVAYGNGTFLAVGFNQNFGVQALYLTSTNGIDWTGIPSPTAANGLVFADGKFVVAGVTSIVTSVDGHTWAPVSSPPVNLLQDVTYANGTFVAVGYYQIMTSSNAVNWRALPFNEILFAVTYAQNFFIAAGWAGTIATSPDGRTWTELFDSPTTSILDVAEANGITVAVGDRAILTSGDGGETWTFTQAQTVLLGVTHAQGLFVAVGGNGATLYSTDGLDWHPGNLQGFANSLSDVAYGNGVFVAVGYGRIVSSDGINWTVSSPDSERPAFAVAYGNGMFLALGHFDVALISQNGYDWQRVQSPRRWIEGLVFDGRHFIGVGLDGTIISTADASRWETLNSGTAAPLHDIAINNHTYVAVGDSGTILTSRNGTQWEPSPSGTRSRLNGVGASGKGFIAVGDYGTVLRSTKR